MPSLGAGMDAGTLLEWYVAPGDEVRRGQVVALVETDKAAIEVEVFHDGVVTELVVDPGTKVPVGTVLARLGEASSAGGPATPGAATDDVAARPEEGRRAPADDVTTARSRGARPRAGPAVQSPLVRRLATERHVDLATVAGTGRAGLITRGDVLGAAARVAGGDAGRDGGTEDRGADDATTPASTVPADLPAAVRDRAGDRTRDRAGDRAGRPAATPYARRLAADRGLDLATVRGTGPGGAVVARDLAAPRAPDRLPPAHEAAPPREVAVPSRAPGPGAPAAGSAMRRAIARAMEQSNREIPQYHLGQWVDVEATLGRLEAANAERAPADRVLPAALVLHATALACRDHPELNGTWVDGSFRPADHVHVGVAISLRGGGLVAPAIHDTDQRSVEEVMAALADLVRRARAGRLRGTELTDPTITVTNLGDRGVDTVHGLVHPPQVALVGAGRITPRPWAVDDLLAVRRVLHLTLAADHRASDGHLGGRFLAAVAHHLTGSETS